jgi:ArsR family transcriptional regulator
LPSPAHIRGTVAAIVDQPDDLRELRVFHKALADVNRLRIVKRLAEGPATVGDLIETVGLSQPLVSWHVSRLKAAGVVLTRRAGREVMCQLRPNVFSEVAERERFLLGFGDAATGATAAAPAPVGTPDASIVTAIPAASRIEAH